MIKDRVYDRVFENQPVISADIISDYVMTYYVVLMIEKSPSQVKYFEK